jgi:hypothetical protein
MGLAFGENGCIVLPFFEPCPYLLEGFFMELGDFIFFQILLL